MAAVMDVIELESPEFENGGGLFGPNDEDEEMVHSLGKVRTAVHYFTTFSDPYMGSSSVLVLVRGNQRSKLK